MRTGPPTRHSASRGIYPINKRGEMEANLSRSTSFSTRTTTTGVSPQQQRYKLPVESCHLAAIAPRAAGRMAKCKRDGNPLYDAHVRAYLPYLSLIFIRYNVCIVCESDVYLRVIFIYCEAFIMRRYAFVC